MFQETPKLLNTFYVFLFYCSSGIIVTYGNGIVDFLVRTIIVLFMAWADRYSQGDSLVEIKLNGPAKLYMLIDSRYIPKPAFLAAYQNTNRTVNVESREGSTVPMQLYMLAIDTAGTVLLGGPEQGGIGGGEIPWVALLDCRNDNGQIRVAAKPWPFIRTATAGEKALLFSDREHTIDTLPLELANGVLVTIPNAMRFADTGSLMTLRVNRPGTVNCLLDTMYTTYPSNPDGVLQVTSA